MKNLGAMMKQAQQMQSKMAEMQEQLAATEMTGSSGAGMVSVTLNGKAEARAVKIDRAAMGDDNEMLEDLIVAAINDAKAKVDAHAKEKMSELTGGIELPPGMQLPF
ncbi:MAG: YbaB/EbfC family nucleoid-associated protein [Rhodospirillaceae bacterium]|jgi:hypothetical protein|nr:YbaB/EbfC family nucleoid-associated protein [Rhodospirillaceae bacterium]MBT7486118.1 YbaB/EbfC family nucleoid-associated protein [Rhodospirillales bacterium]MBT4699761.1 YbaB/EbfC family nucleoid-associated protein [Rhodospirillaceae bacterium]MBT5034654.1 YbaB/EbfC family nucleoid-associated protein [Rhodospirillaceae bacterium]MBT6220498.1 YbaB/EbfC family nucleoid-associated protein [Rhodospirillaceae bacterium]